MCIWGRHNLDAGSGMHVDGRELARGESMALRDPEKIMWSGKTKNWRRCWHVSWMKNGDRRSVTQGFSFSPVV